jgi:hypothetical protein
MNPFVITRIIGIDYKLPCKPSSNIPTEAWADWVPIEIYNLWGDEGKLWLKKSFNNEKTQDILSKYYDLEKQLENEPVGSKRSEMVTELFAMKKIEV